MFDINIKCFSFFGMYAYGSTGVSCISNDRNPEYITGKKQIGVGQLVAHRVLNTMEIQLAKVHLSIM